MCGHTGPVPMSDKSVAPKKSILRRNSSFSVPNDGVGGVGLHRAASVSNLALTSRAIGIPGNGQVRGTPDSATSGSSGSLGKISGESFLKLRGETSSDSKAFVHLSGRGKGNDASSSKTADEDKWGPSAESSPESIDEDDEAGGRVRRGDALTGLESPLHELLERDRRRDLEQTGGESCSMGGSLFNTMDEISAFSIDEVAECDVTPLPTPDVSKHGTNEAWLFMSQSKSQRHRRFSDTGDGESSGPDSERNVRSSKPDGAESGGSGRGMRRVGSVVSFNDATEVHDIGSMNDLIKEKKCKAKKSMLSSLKGELKAIMVNYGMKTEKPKDAPVIDGLKDSRRNMFENIDNTIAVNENRRAWETRELSLRGGNEYKKMMGSIQRSSSSPHLSLLDAEGHGG